MQLPQTFMLAAMLAALGLTLGCGAGREATATADRLTDQVQAQTEAATESEQSLVRRADQPYLGEVRPAPSRPELPPRVESDAGITLSLPTPLPPHELGARIERATGIATVIDLHPDMRSSDHDPDSDAISLQYVGPLSRLLDQLSRRWDTDWDFTDGVISVTNSVTRIYRIRASVAESEVTLQTTGAGEDTGTQSTSMQMQTAFWTEIESTLVNLISVGSYQLSPATGIVTVTAPPSVHRRVSDYLEQANSIFDARIAIEVVAAFLDVSDLDDFGFSLDFLQDAYNGDGTLGFGITAGDSSTGYASFRVSDAATGQLDSLAGSSALLRAMASTNRVVDYRTANTITRHGSPVPISLARKQKIVTNVTVTTTDGSSSTQIEPETLSTGLSMSVYPRIIDSDQVQLTLSLVASDLVRLTRYSPDNTSTVELPTVEERRLTHDFVLAANETILLAGYEQEKADFTDTGVGQPHFKLLGGGQKGDTKRTRLFLLVSARVLP